MCLSPQKRNLQMGLNLLLTLLLVRGVVQIDKKQSRYLHRLEIDGTHSLEGHQLDLVEYPLWPSKTLPLGVQ